MVTPGKVKRRVRLIAVTKDAMEVVNTTTGEVKAATPYVGNRAWRDVSPFVKVFDTEALLKLGMTEVKVFFYLLEIMDFNGRAYFEEDEFSALTGLGKRSAYYGLKGLVEKDFIRRDGGGAYWVNPNIAFRGNRDELMQIV